MSHSDYIIEIDGVNDRKEFFRSVLSLFAPLNATLTTWGKLPRSAIERLSSFRRPCFWLRRLCFREANFELNQKSLPVFLETLSKDEVLPAFTWGVRKGNKSLALCGNWEDHLIINGSNLVEEEKLMDFISRLKEDRVIIDFDKISD